MGNKRKVEPSKWEKLDAAVMRRFPAVHCETDYNIFAMRMQTTWWKAGTDGEKLKPAQARLVREFVSGYIAALSDAEMSKPKGATTL